MKFASPSQIVLGGVVAGRSSGLIRNRSGRVHRCSRKSRPDFDINKKMNSQLIFVLATARFVERREEALFLGQPGTGRSHIAQALGLAAIRHYYRAAYREAHKLIEELADAATSAAARM
jgi:DNA replication protein DnaC